MKKINVFSKETLDFNKFAEKINPSFLNTFSLLNKNLVLDKFLHKKFPTLKWYSIEDSEGFLSFLHQLIYKYSSNTHSNFLYLSMPHRGRLNILNALEYNKKALLSKIIGNSEFNPALNNFGFEGDVLSHLYKRKKISTTQGFLDVTLFPNPSHLEAINPVAYGYTKSRILSQLTQSYGKDFNTLLDKNDKSHSSPLKSNLLVQVHGDASISGQGIVYEMQNMSLLPDYSIGGSIHVIVNNGIGFTTESCDGRSSQHACDIAKITESPIIQVDGTSMLDVFTAANLALFYRQTYHKDVFVDILGHRRYGHNEVDDPTFTNPVMYKDIRSRKPLSESIINDFIAILSDIPEYKDTKYVTPEYWHNERNDEELKWNQALVEVKTNTTSSKDNYQSKYFDFNLFACTNTTSNANNITKLKYQRFDTVQWKTGLPLQTLAYVGRKSVEIPQEWQNTFITHPHLQKVHIKPRQELCNTLETTINIPELTKNQILANTKIDWSTAEAFALGSLLLQGINIRLSGQDSGRATFSHRHAVLVNYEPKKDAPNKLIPLNYIQNNNLHNENEGGIQNHIGHLQIINSPLNELATLSYECGYAWNNAFNHLTTNKNIQTQFVLWEAQYGDFVNCAQPCIDTFISSCYAKWGLSPGGLTMLLPHGIDGTGPEHSSCRIERFLQLSNDPETTNIKQDPTNYINLTVANPSTTAQYYHLLRSQAFTIHNNYLTAPLIMIAPKILLRLQEAKSSMSDFLGDTHFKPILFDENFTQSPPSALKYVIFCSGKHYYTLNKYITNLAEDIRASIFIVRIELLSPFPATHLQALLRKISLHRRQSSTIKFVWSQEEHRNQGPWQYMQTRFRNRLNIELKYNGRQESAIPATGIVMRHKQQEIEILSNLFNI